MEYNRYLLRNRKTGNYMSKAGNWGKASSAAVYTSAAKDLLEPNLEPPLHFVPKVQAYWFDALHKAGLEDRAEVLKKR